MKTIAWRLAAAAVVTLFAAAETTAVAQTVAQTAGETVDGPAVTWRLGAWGKPRANTKGIETLKKHVEERTGGKFNITIGYEAFGGPKELLDLVKVGTLQATMFCASYHPDKTPAYAALDLPFLPLPDSAAQIKVHEAFHKHPYVLKELAGWNAMPFISSLLPQFEFIGRGKAPKTIEGFKGLRVRALGGLGEAMKKLGAIPTSVPATEVYTALERGTVDAVSLAATYAHYSFRTYEIGKWYTTNLSPGTIGCPTVIGIAAYGELPPQYKKLIDEAKPLAYAAMVAAYKEADDKNIPIFKKQGLEFITYGDAELARFRKIAAQPVWDDWVSKSEAKGIPAKELLDLILKAAKSPG